MVALLHGTWRGTTAGEKAAIGLTRQSGSGTFKSPMAHMALRGVVTAVAGIAGYEVLQLLRTTREAASEIVAETGMAVRSVLADMATTFATVADALQSLVQVKTDTLARLIAKTGHLLEQALMIAVPIAVALGCAALMPHVQKVWARAVRVALTETGFNPKGISTPPRRNAEDWRRTEQEERGRWPGRRRCSGVRPGSRGLGCRRMFWPEKSGTIQRP